MADDGICVSGEHYEALERARKYFGIDKSFPSADHYLALAMAMVLFGQQGRGRAKGTKAWTYQKYLDLADACNELYKKDSTLSDAEICRRLGKGGDANSDFRHYDPEHLRTRLPEVRRAIQQYFSDLETDRAMEEAKEERVRQKRRL